jgi:hypothetical protein
MKKLFITKKKYWIFLRFIWELIIRFDDGIGRAPNCSNACLTASWRTSKKLILIQEFQDK